MFTYTISTGEMTDGTGALVGTGYSGLGADKNQTADEGAVGEGPIPEGLWHIGAAITHPTLGPLSMPLTPDETTDTQGRSGFYIHGDSASHPGAASHGCIVLDHAARLAISTSGDMLLNVVA